MKCFPIRFLAAALTFFLLTITFALSGGPARKVAASPRDALAAGNPDWKGRRAELFIEQPYAPDPDRMQGLYALAERQGDKPWGLHIRDDGLMNRRTIFRDRDFGTYIWMLDDSHASERCQTGSVWPAWNADASLMHLPAHRVGPEGRASGWYATGDFSRLRRAFSARMPIWDRQNPDLAYYLRDSGQLRQLVEENVRTAEIRIVAEWEPYVPREIIYGFTPDNRYLFLDTPPGDVFWVTYEPGEGPILPGTPRGESAMPGIRDLDWEELLARHRKHIRRAITVDEELGPIIRIRVGVLINRETGEMRHMIVPITDKQGMDPFHRGRQPLQTGAEEPGAFREYLRIFMSGRINFPAGEGWKDYRVHLGENIDEMFEIYRYYPYQGQGGHWTQSPDRKYTAKDGLVVIWPTLGGPATPVRLVTYHMHWDKHPRFFVSWARGWDFVTFLRSGVYANIIFQVFTDGTFQPVVDTKHLFNGFYGGADFTMQSPDATKIHYGSSMMGRFKNYVAVMARPRPPVNLTWRPERGGLRLEWEPSSYSRETRGYLVYRSRKSGDGYRLMTPEPVEETSWFDGTVERGIDYYYVATSLEHSGLESGYSNEAARAGAGLPRVVEAPLVIYAEAEDAIRDLYTDERPGVAMGRDVWGASDWYYVYRHPEAARGEVRIPVEVPVPGSYYLWARTRGGHGEEWMWVKAREIPLPLRAGRTELPFTLEDEHLDLICLTTDAGFTPEGPRPEKSAPPPVRGLRAENVRERVNHLRWDGPDEPSVSYYQVYASGEPIREISQELLVGSPSEGELYDWGLKAGQRYYYAVTAVDRRGNESEAVFAEAATPEGEPEFKMMLKFSEGERVGRFEETRGEAVYGEFYVVPEEPDRNAVSWEIDLPWAGDYYLWLRYLHRGSGRRGGQRMDVVNVLLADKQVAELRGYTELHVPDGLIAEGHPLASQLWTWRWPGVYPDGEDLIHVPLPAGKSTLRLENLHPGIRYDALVITNEISWQPDDGRINQEYP